MKIITVQGQPYEVWTDYNSTCTYAKSTTGDTKIIGNGGLFFTKDEKTIRKAIAPRFGHSNWSK